jgi:hypothetical protein
VDGTEQGFRSLSHWPGNTTPAALRHDLSTGIALAFARLSPAEQRAVVGSFDLVVNNHYDTDGVLSAFALMHPDLALPRAEAMLAAAATGDFGTWNGPDALAVELTVMSITRHRDGPLATQLGPDAEDDLRWAAGYTWLLGEMAGILDQPYTWERLWSERHRRVLADIERIDAGQGISVKAWPEEELALVSSDRPTTSIGLHHAAGDCFRVLLVRPSREGFRYLFRYRDESWFTLASRNPLPRAPLEPVVAALNRAEGSAKQGPRWWCGSIDAPVAEMGFGDREQGHNAFFEDPDVESAAPSRLPPSAVLDALREAFATPAPAPAPA